MTLSLSSMQSRLLIWPYGLSLTDRLYSSIQFHYCVYSMSTYALVAQQIHNSTANLG